MFRLDTRIHESLLTLQRRPLPDSQATFPLHLYTFPTVREAFSGGRPGGLSRKLSEKGSIKLQQVIVLLTAWTRTDKGANLKLQLWQMMEFQSNLNTKVHCKEFWLLVPEYDQKILRELSTAASNEVSGGFQQSQADCLDFISWIQTAF